MEGIIFWLVPVVLLILFIVVLLKHQEETAKPRLTLIEPIGTVINRWQLARSVGEKYWLEYWLSVLQSTPSHNGSALEMVLNQTDRVNVMRSAVTLLDGQPLPLLGEQRLIQQHHRYASVVIGLLDEVLPFVRYGTAGKRLLTDEEKQELERLSRNAAAHGFLPLVVAHRTLTSPVFPKGTQNHSLVGTILLEPELQRDRFDRVKANRGQIKLTGVLPTLLLEWLWRKLNNDQTFVGVATREKALHPKAEEETWLRSPYIGELSFQDRYKMIRFLQHHYDCRVTSAIAQDQELPVAYQK